MGPEKRLFAWSVLYLFAIFAALVADKWIGAVSYTHLRPTRP